MGIDDISGAIGGFWARARTALSTPAPTAPSQPQQGPKPAGDSAQLTNKDQYFAGYAMPTPGQSSEMNLWAPLVIAPGDGTPPGKSEPQG